MELISCKVEVLSSGMWSHLNQQRLRGTMSPKGKTHRSRNQEVDPLTITPLTLRNLFPVPATLGFEGLEALVPKERMLLRGRGIGVLVSLKPWLLPGHFRILMSRDWQARKRSPHWLR